MPAPLCIQHLRLHTHLLHELHAFYSSVLLLPTSPIIDDAFTVRAGLSTMAFSRAAAMRPFYHLAFNIPHNRLADAKTWLRPRVAIHRQPAGSEDYHFPSWNAHAFYVFDPAGNILEFIARRNLHNAAADPFGPHHILCVSEIGIVVPDVHSAALAIHHQLALPPFPASLPLPGADFAALGSDDALLVLVNNGRFWNVGGPFGAEIFPTSVQFLTSRPASLASASIPPEISIKSV